MVIRTEAGSKVYCFNNTPEFKQFMEEKKLIIFGFYDNKPVYLFEDKKMMLVGQNRLMQLKKTQEPYIVRV